MVVPCPAAVTKGTDEAKTLRAPLIPPVPVQPAATDAGISTLAQEPYRLAYRLNG
jgi:hypothetical protein